MAAISHSRGTGSPTYQGDLSASAVDFVHDRLQHLTTSLPSSRLTENAGNTAIERSAHDLQKLKMALAQDVFQKAKAQIDLIPVSQQKASAMVELAEAYRRLKDLHPARHLLKEVVEMTVHLPMSHDEKASVFLELAENQLILADRSAAEVTLSHLIKLLQEDMLPCDQLHRILACVNLQLRLKKPELMTTTIQKTEKDLIRVLSDPSTSLYRKVKSLCQLAMIHGKMSNSEHAKELLDQAQQLADTSLNESWVNLIVEIAEARLSTGQIKNTQEFLRQAARRASDIQGEVEKASFLLKMATAQFLDDSEGAHISLLKARVSVHSVVKDPTYDAITKFYLLLHLARVHKKCSEENLAKTALKKAREWLQNLASQSISIASCAEALAKTEANLDHLEGVRLLIQTLKDDQESLNLVLVVLVKMQAKRDDLPGLHATLEQMPPSSYKIKAYLHFAECCIHNNAIEQAQDIANQIQALILQLGGYDSLDSELLDYLLYILDNLQDLESMKKILTKNSQEASRNEILDSIARLQAEKYDLDSVQQTIEQLPSAYNKSCSFIAAAQAILQEPPELV